jgi:hypothetical protein
MSSALRQAAQLLQREAPKFTRGVRTSAPARGGYHYVRQPALHWTCRLVLEGNGPLTSLYRVV